jgi:H+/Cl- antiporter ClcA
MNNSAMNSTANSVAAPANTKMSRLGNAVKNIGNTRETLDISWNTIGIITVLGLTYIVAASIGINTFSKCEKFKGKKLQENLNKILVATLGMAIAIPFTLTMTKMFSNEMPVFLSHLCHHGCHRQPRSLSTGPSIVKMLIRTPLPLSV